MRSINLFTLCLLTIVPVTALSAPVPIDSSLLGSSNSDMKYGIGATSSIAQRPFVGVNDQKTSLPYLSFKYKSFYVEGSNVGYKIIDKDKYSLDLLVTPRYLEVKESFAKNGELDGIDETKQTYFAGVSSQYRSDFATYSVQLLKDLKESDGGELNVSISKTYKTTDTLSISPALGLNWQDAKLVDHFYGVQANETTVDRPQYKGQATVNSFLSLTSVWNITQNIQLLGQIKYESLGAGITRSPIVDETNITSYVLGTVYRF